uniref:glutathione transferase n=1 Tax=Ciona savignyi TaxID=51511 RepID=H2ZGW2_CIOSA
MTSYKLYYFNARGRAESTRLLFAAAGVAYEDYRYEREEWGIAKPSMPFGQLPVLEVNGTKYGESAAINRYLAKKFNMMGKDDESALRIDSYAELLYGLIPKLPLFE